MPILGEIRIFAGNFAPSGWAFCEGQLLPISENDTLFTLIGTTYGGDGESTFALPDLRGRAPLHQGINPANGISYALAEMAGTESVTLTPLNLPSHRHMVNGPVYIPSYGENPGAALPASGNYPAITSGLRVYSTAKHATNRLAPLRVSPVNGAVSMMQVHPAGGSQPKENMQPFLAVSFIISLYGSFPIQ
jgi:microcystin-dependent protein